MKYLKSFESLGICEYYCQISEDEYIDGISGINDDLENFTQNEIDKLKKLSKISYIDYYLNPWIIRIKLFDQKYTEGMITHKTKEEWFYLHDIDYTLYYKCDQFDGLLKCIEEEL